MTDSSLPSLFLRNVFFTLLQPGIVVGVIPWFVFRSAWRGIGPPFTLIQIGGMVLFVIGFCVMIHCIARFASKGRGTLSPADPTKNLVILGLYKFSRNPMYIGVMGMLLGEVLFTESTDLLWYSLGVFVLFNAFIFGIEEPRLRRDFGDEYMTYCSQVRRWI